MSRTREQIRLEVREYLGEDDTESDSLWSNSFLNLWINRFIKMVAEATECIEGYGTITLVAATGSYSLPTNHVKPILVKLSSPEKTLKAIDVQDLRKLTITSTGEPSRYMMFNNLMYVYPIPTAAGTLNVWSVMTSTTMTADANVSPLPEELDDVVVKLVLAKAKQQEEEYGVANQYYSEIP
jgi:hypothetical protein